MIEKKWLKFSFIFVLTIILSIGIFNYVIDPFHQYRVNTFYPISYVNKLQRYINPGFAKNYNYDTIILGSSMSENFILSDVKEILGFRKPLKLCISGTSAYEESLTLQTALQHKKIKNVIYGLDTFLFWGKPTRIKHGEQSFPFYLYDNLILNDYKYIFSVDTTIHSFQTVHDFIFDNKQTIKYNYNKMYQWQDNIPSSHFSENHVVKEWLKRGTNSLAYQSGNSYDYYKKSFDINFLTIFKKYTTTKFIIYFPPYSMLHYKHEKETKMFKDRLLFKKYIFEVTKKLSNVHIYDFQIAKNITHNLNNYHDLGHYHQKINKWILEQIKDDNFKLNENNIDTILNKLNNQVDRYQIPKVKY